MSRNGTLSAIIVAGGSSRRMGFDKMTAPLAGLPVISHSLSAFQRCGDVAEIVLVCSAGREEEFRDIARPFDKVRNVTPGGAERPDSVRCGLDALQDADWVAVHDGARPLIRPETVSECFRAAREFGAAACAEPLADTLHRVDGNLGVTETVPRDSLWRVQTPQILPAEDLRICLESAATHGWPATDEVSLLLRAGKQARMVETPHWNFKITFPRDLELAEMAMARTHG